MRAGVWSMVLAGGSGARFGLPKQFQLLAGRSLVAHSVTAALAVSEGVVVALPDPTAQWDRPTDAGVAVVHGGAERYLSVRAALAAIPDDCQVIVVADAAHPLASPTLFAAVIAAVRSGADGAFPGLELTEVLAEIGSDGTRLAGLSRQGRVLVQTPMAFRASTFRQAHAAAPGTVEDSELIAAAGGRVVCVPGDPANLHITTPAELDLARRIWQEDPSPDASPAWG